MDSKGQNPKTKKIRSDALIEALRGFGGDTAKSLNEDFLKQIPNDIFEQVGLRPKFDARTPAGNESMHPQGQEDWERKLRQAEAVRRQEKTIYNAKQQETKTQVSVLVEEVKRLASSVQNLEKEVEITAIQTPVEPGVYHVSFFQKLISFLRSLSEKIEDSTLWLSAANTKSKKRSHYWGQVQKSGSKFMLSQERYMATQAG